MSLLNEVRELLKEENTEFGALHISTDNITFNPTIDTTDFTIKYPDDLDKDILEQALKLTEIKTRRELVDHALRELIRHKQQKKLLELKGKISWEGDLNEMREGRGV